MDIRGRWSFASFIAVVIVFASCAATASDQRWQEGVHYSEAKANAPSASSAGGTVVTEMFWYSCPACNGFEPYLRDWAAARAGKVTLVRVPVTWSRAQRADARLFYALTALHRQDLHQLVYDEVHKRRVTLSAPTDEETKRLQVRFALAHGISESDFLRALSSKEVGQGMKVSDEAVRRYKVINTPTLIVSGKYVTTKDQAGGDAALLELLDYLVQRTLSASAPGKSNTPPGRQEVKRRAS